MRTKCAGIFIAVLSTLGALLFTGCVLALIAAPGRLVYAAPESPDGGVVGTGTPASCTEAALNTRLAGGGTVTFNCGPNPYTITLTVGKNITLNTTIDGGGKITLSGNDTVKPFYVDIGDRLTLRNINLVKGNGVLGGCITVFGGTLIITQTTLSGCKSVTSSPFAGYGGAIYANDATVVLTDTNLINNSAQLHGGGVYLYDGQATFNNVQILNNTATFTQVGSGGGIYMTATAQLTVYNSQVSNNRIGYVGDGGGVYVFNGLARLFNSTLNGNTASNAASGGGMFIDYGTTTLAGVTIRGSDGVYDGGGMTIRHSTANLTQVTLDGNDASSNGGGFFAFQSTVNLTDVVVSRNTASSDGAGIHCYTCVGKFLRVTVDGNSAEDSRDGGGLLLYQSTLSIRDSTVSNNTNRYGGGLFASKSVLALDNVTFNNNVATRTGGGVQNEDSFTALTNVTLSANQAITGGGIHNDPFTDPTVITLTNVTLKDNAATDGGGIYNVNTADAVVRLKNTILADSPSGGNCKGKSVSSAAYSISSDGTCNLSALTNDNNVDPQLTWLAFNGGWTKTHLPKVGSPAINGVSGSDCPSSDQRGIGRPQGASCDVGAIERTSNDPPYPIGAYAPIVVR